MSSNPVGERLAAALTAISGALADRGMTEEESDQLVQELDAAYRAEYGARKP